MPSYSSTRSRRHGSLKSTRPMHTLPHRQHGSGVSVGRGYEADAVYTVTNVSTTTIRRRQELTEVVGILVDLREMQAKEAESADPSCLQVGRRGQVATPHRPHAGAVPHVLATLEDLRPMAETSGALSHGADHPRQGRSQEVMTGPHQTSNAGADVTKPAAALAGQIPTIGSQDPRRVATLTETRPHWDELNKLRIQASLVQHPTATRTRSHAGTIATVFAKMATRAVSTTPPHADTC